jgi:hypothetical protein
LTCGAGHAPDELTFSMSRTNENTLAALAGLGGILG